MWWRPGWNPIPLPIHSVSVRCHSFLSPPPTRVVRGSPCNLRYLMKTDRQPGWKGHSNLWRYSPNLRPKTQDLHAMVCWLNQKGQSVFRKVCFFLIFKAARTDASLENGLPVIHFKKILLHCLKQKKTTTRGRQRIINRAVKCWSHREPTEQLIYLSQVTAAESKVAQVILRKAHKECTIRKNGGKVVKGSQVGANEWLYVGFYIQWPTKKNTQRRPGDVELLTGPDSTTKGVLDQDISTWLRSPAAPP